MLKGKNIREFAIITVGTAIIASAVYFFMLPSQVSVGSVSALAMVLSNFVPYPVSLITLVINAVLLLVGFLLIGREFGGKTVYTTILMPGIMRIFEVAFPNFESLTNDPLLDVICYILVVGVGLAMLFSTNASSGGLDIIAKLMNKYMHLELGKAMSLSGMLVALSAAFCFDSKTVVLSLISTFFGGLIVDYFIFGMNLKRRVCIISPKTEEILAFILHELHSGATVYESFGAYKREKQVEIIAIVDKQEYRSLMEFMKKTDPKAFITVYSVNEINYQPKIR